MTSQIVQLGDILIACPYDNSGKGGTWYTINYAKSVLKKPALAFDR